MGIVTDLAVKTSWNVASGFKNTFTITVTEGGSAYSLASRTFSLQIRKIGSETNFVNLTEGSGITNGGATGILTIVLTAAQSATLGNENYLWQLTCITDETRWLSGTVEATTGVYDGDTATALSASVSLTGTALTLAITLASTTASGITFTPAANIAATNVQSAIEEVVSDLTTIANAKVADAINDGTTTIAPSQNAVFDALALKLNSTISYKTESDDHTLDADDLTDLAAGKQVYFFMSKATASTLTLPSDATLAIPVGASFVVMRTHASGLVTFAAGSGATASGSAGVLTDAGLNVAMRVEKTSANTWLIQNGGPGVWLDYTPSFTGFSVNPTVVAKYMVIGKTCCVSVAATANGTSNASDFTITLPFTSTSTRQQSCSWSLATNGSILTASGRMNIALSTNIANLFSNQGTGTWATSGNKSAHFNIFYEIA